MTSQENGDDVPWSSLPSVVLEHIYAHLSHKDRFSASLVCRAWSGALLSAHSWRLFTIHSRTFSVKHYNVLTGYRREFSEDKLKTCLRTIGPHIHNLTILAIDNYLHLHSLLNALTQYQSEEKILQSLKEFHFTYSCETRNRAGSYLHGMGAPVRRTIFQFLSNTNRLESLSLDDLLLNRECMEEFVENVCEVSSEVSRLSLRNCSSEFVSVNGIGALSNLRTFITSPQQISDILIVKLAENGLESLHLVQDKYTSYTAPIGRQHWLKVRALNPNLRVKLMCSNIYKHDVLVQPGAPVSHVLYDTPHSVISPVTVWALSDYAHTLRVYGHKSLPKIHGRQIVHDRADSLLLLLLNNCPHIDTLIVRDRISTASILLIAHKCKHLKRFYVRKNSLLTRLDWSREPGWEDEFYLWLKKSCRSLAVTEHEIGKMLGHSWQALTDGEFESLSDIDM